MPHWGAVSWGAGEVCWLQPTAGVLSAQVQKVQLYCMGGDQPTGLAWAQGSSRSRAGGGMG